MPSIEAPDDDDHRRDGGLRHYCAYGMWFSFGTRDGAGPPFGAPPRPGYGGGSLGCQKCLMGPRTGAFTAPQEIGHVRGGTNPSRSLPE